MITAMIKLIGTLFLLLVMITPTKSAGLINGTTSCLASGAVVVTALSTPVSWAVIQAPSANTGVIYVGGSSTVSSTTTVGIAAFGSLTLQAKGNNAANYDLGKNVWFACSQSGDKIVYVGAQ